MDATQTDILPPPTTRVATNCVLVVDDSAAQRQLLSAVLTRFGLEVIAAATAEDALEICAGEAGARIGIVVSDWQMPGMDGPDFCRAFRALRGESFAYFILLTSQTDRTSKTEGLKAGADDFVMRPVDMSELRARIDTGRRILDMHEVLLHRNYEVQTALGDLQALQAAINRDLAEARSLQQAFLPPRRYRAGGCDIALRLVTCDQIGGDLVGYFRVSQDEIAIYSVDVSGHGIASALLTGRLAELFSDRVPYRNVAFATDGSGAHSPEQVMTRLNEFMLQELSSDIYFTAVLAYVNLHTGALRFCQAGHPHPMIRRAHGAVERIGSGGPPVGLLPGAHFEVCTATLQPNDVFLAYSDGLTECVDTWGDMFEEEGLMELFARVPSDLEGAIGCIEEGLSNHAGIQRFDDDMSMILLKFEPMAP
ncbi:fused response regulator/phosphatase [Jannaschia pagri]|uniref:Fused response regulator/phosphatase n=1 Tax=Jannaschia pagri TaxID=2829797 RepID=A0ABQ4NQ23_9RHOB|nr:MULTISPECIES: SpoIIE family protein phosphatase [unclassified Jannaschia]GIT92643.1 fused response regulator/phosphatase [Jannaschia sp. AI_61]GIT96497.1 fused response regulator/phosphatase [Jannaschia sp. AI_62]